MTLSEDKTVSSARRNPYCALLIVGYSSVVLLSFFLFRAAHAATYRCEDASGVTVLTDSPAQLHKCSLLLPDAQPHAAAKRGGRYPPPPSISLPQDISPEAPDGTEGTTIPHSELPVENPPIAADREPIAIPVTTVGGSVTVPVLLNGTKPVQLILDTGATMTVLATDVAIDLALLSDSQSRMTTINTAGGPVQATISRLDSVQVGPAVVRNVSVVIHDIPHAGAGIDGLLGMSFLRHFLVTLDADHGRLYLRPRSDSSTGSASVEKPQEQPIDAVHR